MKKRFWTRLISAVLTMAMAFSILAVPVSAASSGNSWAYGKVNEDGSAEWTTEAGIRVALQFAMEQQGESLGGAMLNAVVEEYRIGFASQDGMVEYSGKIPAGACIGVTTKGGNGTKWYDEEAYRAILQAMTEGGSIHFPVTDFDTGEILVSGVKVPVMGGSDDSVVTPAPEPSKKVVTAVVGIPVDSGEADFSELFSGMIAWYPVEAGVLTDEMRADIEQNGWTIREDVEVSTDIDFGFSASADGKIFWYTEELLEQAASKWDDEEEPVRVELNEKTGALVFVSADGKTASISPADKTPSVDEGKSAVVGGTVVVLAAVGAAAAATGVYLYTHPEKVEAIKDFFADLSANVQAKVEQFTTNVKGAFGIVVPDSEDEEAEPAAVTVEEAQAA